LIRQGFRTTEKGAASGGCAKQKGKQNYGEKIARGTTVDQSGAGPEIAPGIHRECRAELIRLIRWLMHDRPVLGPLDSQCQRAKPAGFAVGTVRDDQALTSGY
jgi:hypothetical protein